MSLSTPMNQRQDNDDTIRQRSGWLIPIAVFAVTALLSAMVLLFYLAPTPASFIEEHPAPTSRTDPISLSVSGVRMTIPANYILYKSARQGGARPAVALVTTFPEFRGYSDWDSQAFSSNAADSTVIYLLIREEPLNLSEAEKLRRIYMNLVANPDGGPGPFGLTAYEFRNDSGYRNEDLFVGGNSQAPIVLRCDRFSQQVRSPSCLREMLLKPGVAINYRFKRAHLSDWKEIADGVNGLIRSFRNHAR
jgi:hypothetical protein